MANVAKDFAQLISQSKSNKTGPYDTQATVKRVEGNTVWVSIPGGVDETPIDKTVNCSAGDKVQVRVSGGRAWITGNASAPPTDDKTANEAKGVAVIAQTTAVDAKETADAVEGIAQAAQASATTAANAAASAVTAAGNAQTAANSAQSSADNASEYAARALGNLSTVQSVAETLTWITAHGTMTNTQSLVPPETALNPRHVYFVIDANGDYEVGGTRYSVVTDPDVADIASYYVLSINESLNNYVATHLSVTSEGLWIIPDAGGNKVLIATGSGSTYTAAGTYIVGANNVVLAKFLASGTTIGAESGAHTTLDADGQTVYKDSTNAIAHIGIGSFPDPEDPDTPIRGSYYTFGERTGQIGIGSVSMGVGCTASGEGAVAIGEFSQATGEFSFAHGIDYDGYALASGRGSHAEGTSIASGNVAHSEGRGARAIGNNSHAEGVSTVARGDGSHAGGFETEAQGAYQTAIGKLNVKDSTSAFIIGCGKYEDDNPIRKNALTVDWSGNVEADGDITDGSGNVLADKADTSAVPTKTSDLTNDSGFITAETDPTVPSWAKASTKPTYTASEVGALPNTTVIPTKTSDLTNDSHFVAKGDFVISSHTTTNKTISGGSTMSAETQTFTKSGYYPLAISGWVLNGSNATNLTLVHLYISSQASGSVGVTYRIHNAGSSQSTSSNVKVYILWIKEN